MLMNDVGIDAGWRILHGSQEFFEITKGFHNALQGSKLTLSERKKRLYTQINQSFARFTHLNHDCVIVHDPQPLALIQDYRKQQPWIWRCHIDLTDPHRILWDFLKGFILKYDQVVVSNEKYFKKDLPVPQRLIYPAINPLSPKNAPISDRVIRDQLARADVPTDKPIITQVSRLDPWKDPEGVIDVFKLVKEKVDCRLITLVNAVQRASRVIIQKSTKAGFADRIVHLLRNPKEGRELGRVGRETVREKFLITRLLGDYLDMLNTIMRG